MANKSKNKDDKIVVRIDTNLKEEFTKYVESKGSTVSDYIRQMIMKELYGEPTVEYTISIEDFLKLQEKLSTEVEVIKEKFYNFEKRVNKKFNLKEDNKNENKGNSMEIEDNDRE